MRVWLEPRRGTGPAGRGRAAREHAVPAAPGGRALGTRQAAARLRRPRRPQHETVAAGFRLEDVAASSSASTSARARSATGWCSDEPAMMGGGVCWLDYDNDGWLDLFAVNSYADQQPARVAGPRRAADERALPQHRRPLRERDEALRGRAPAARRGLRRRRPERRRLHRPLRHDGDRRRAALEQRRRHLHRGRAQGRGRVVRLALRRGGRGRERRRPARPVRRRLHRHATPDPGLRRGLPDEPRGRARPPVPQRGQEALPRGRRARGPRSSAVRPQPRRRLLGLQPRRASRPLRRERRGREQALPQRARRPARLPLRRPREDREGRGPRTPAWASPPPTRTATGAPTSSSRTRAGRRTPST